MISTIFRCVGYSNVWRSDMSTRYRWNRLASLLIVAALVGFAGCGGEDDDPGDGAGDGGMMMSDAGVDGGDGADAGGPDGGAACTFFPDSCPDGRNCYSQPDGMPRVCAQYSTDSSSGDSCMAANDCGEGQRCFQQTCRPICNPDNLSDYGCGSESVCLELELDGKPSPWGVCEPKEDQCTSWPNDSCGQGENCYPLPQGLRCRSYNAEADAGDRCAGARECGDNQVCVTIEGGDSRCRNKCDMDHPCPEGSCQELDRSYGFCLPPSDGG
jgi:hypothetical protein